MSFVTPLPVVEYLRSLNSVPHPQLSVIAAEGRGRGLPIVDDQTGALLHALVLCSGARHVLEIGTAIGYSTLWMAAALPEGGMVITLERETTRAERAREHFAAAGVASRVSVVIGDAARYLHKIAGPFDVIFQDGDKLQYEPMLDRLAALVRPGGVIVTDNILWSGEVVEGYVAAPVRSPEDTRAIRSYNRALANDDRFVTTFLPIGDGVAISIRR
jgi:predicted O-methyltransferase YrrM